MVAPAPLVRFALLVVTVLLINRLSDAAFTYTSFTVGNQYSTLMGVAVGDVNGDDLPDVVGATYTTSRLVTFFNNGDGTFANGVHRATFDGSSGYQVHLVDWDGDGDLDAVSLIWQSTYVQVFTNSNAGTTWSKATLFNSHQRDINFIDLFDTGNIYAIVGASGSGVSYRTNGGNLINHGAGSFNSVTSLDVDGDGIKDIVGCRSDNVVGYFKGTGSGFSTTYTPIVTSQCLMVKAKDMNGDCNDDLVVSGATTRVFFYEPGSSSYTRTTTMATADLVAVTGAGMEFGDMSEF